MDIIQGRMLAAVCVASCAILCDEGQASAAIVHREVSWSVPSDGSGLHVDLEMLEAQPNALSLGGWHLRISGDSGLMFGTQDAGLMLYSADPGQSGPASLPLNLVVGPFSAFGSGQVSFGTGIGQWRIGQPNYFGFRFTSRTGELHFGWGRMDFGSSAADRTIVEIAWHQAPGVGIQVGHVPAAGPLVLMGIAALVGGPRRIREMRHARRHA